MVSKRASFNCEILINFDINQYLSTNYMFFLAVSNVLATIGGNSYTDTFEFNLLPLENPDQSSCPRPAQFPQRVRGSKGVLSGGKVVICGGRDGEIYYSGCFQYQDDTKEWTFFANMDHARDDMTITPIDENNFWVVGKEIKEDVLDTILLENKLS